MYFMEIIEKQPNKMEFLEQVNVYCKHPAKYIALNNVISTARQLQHDSVSAISNLA